MAYARELLERLGWLPGAPHPIGLQTPDGCSTEVAFVDAADGRLLAVATEAELRGVVARGCRDHPAADAGPGRGCDCPALGPPPAVDRYRPSAALERFVRTRDRQCRIPGCSNRSGWSDLDHVVPHGDGGETSCENLCCLCRRDHRIKTHVPGWRYRLTPDGTLHVTTPSGLTYAERPPGTELLGLTRPADEPDPDPPPF